MRDLARRLLRQEASAASPDGTPASATMLVSEKLRRPISTLAGSTGFLALLARALSLAKAEAPGLGVVRLNPDGSLAGLGTLAPAEVEASGAVLIAQLLDLLNSFIGEALTLRLLRDAWPELPPGADKNSPGSET
jgi:hypothetical protein